MGRIISIYNEEMKNKIIIYLTNKIYPIDMTKSEKYAFKRMCSKFKLIDNILYCKDNDIYKIYICRYEESKRIEKIRFCHNQDHVGPRGTYEKVNRIYSGIKYDDVQGFILTCQNCIRERPPSILTSITPIIPSYQRERLIVDTIDMSVYANHNENYKYIFTFIDSFSKFAWSYPSKRKDGVTFAKILSSHIYNEGLWTILHTDNGGEFINNNVNEILEKFNIKSIHGRPYHPQSQGQIERFNRTLKSRLRRCLDFGIFNWVQFLERVVFEYNNLSHSATGLKPFVLFKGFDIEFHKNNPTRINESDVRIRLSDYVNKYRREYEIRQRDIINIGSIVILVKPYSLSFVRRQALECLYYEDLFEVISIVNEKCEIRNTR
ncbi:Pro-Pol polyprotein, partial [Dictyocoela muelleri]